MLQRIITGVIGGAIFLAFLIFGGIWLEIFVGLLTIVAMQELFKMAKLSILSFEGILATFAALSLTLPVSISMFGGNPEGHMMLFTFFLFLMLTGMVFSRGKYSFEDVGFPFLAAFYVGVGFQNLLTARHASLYIVFFALLIVWATDIGAYFVGKGIGKNKLIPSVSPNKTIEGSIGGIVSAVIVALLMWVFFRHQLPAIGFVKLIVFSVIFSIVGQIGDLVESAIKRYYGVKDSGKLLPGHGGVLDRFDNLIFVFPIMHLLGLF